MKNETINKHVKKVNKIIIISLWIILVMHLAYVFLNIDFKTSICAITLGVLLAGIIMSLGSKIVAVLGWFGVFAIIAIILVAILVSIIIKKNKNAIK